MTNFVISYDLHKRRNYAPLYRLMAVWKATKLTESQWLVRLNCSAGQALDFVCRHLDNDDTATVLEIPHGADWATIRVKPAASAWLSHYVRPSQKAA